MINENIVGGKWKEVKGRIQKAWGALTDDELESTKGDLNQIGGLVQKKYGETQEAIRTKVNGFMKDLDNETPPNEKL